ncbi:MAG: 1-phosphofructokinase family hexose kinase [Gemmatimonadota bacterium]|nr:1-phosphofructokinase family hexose kinase [Gemmatimonadota bacterium]
MGIVTVTINPCIDRNTRVERVEPDRKLRCERPTREPGGGGLNVSRAIRRLGGESLAVYPSGGPVGEILERSLDDEEVAQRPVPVEGWTRENSNVYETSTDRQYRFLEPGPELGEEEWRACLEAIPGGEEAPGWVVGSGSLPPGVPDDFYVRLARRADSVGARTIVDSSGEPLRRAAGEGVFLLKPNMRELGHAVGREIGGEDEQEEACRELVEGGCGAVVLSLGAAGALLVTGERAERLRSPQVPIRSRIGAGDSMVAGIVLGLERGMELRQAVLHGIAAGAAAVRTPGTELCRRRDVERLFRVCR